MKVIVRLPRKTQYGLGRTLGKLLYKYAKRRRHITEVNIRLCFPELSKTQQQLLVKKTIEENAIGFIETAVSWFREPAYAQKYLTINGLEHLEAAKNKGKGVLLVGAHYTTLDLGALLASSVTKIDAMYRPHENSFFNKVMKSSREKFCQQVIDRNNMRGVIKSIKDGHVFWYAPDQDYGREVSVFAPFFGINAATVKFTAKISKICECPVIIFSHHRKNDDSGYLVTFSKALENYPSGDDVKDATMVNSKIEKEVRKYPEQYMWVHRRFKTRPEGEAGYYD